MEEPRLSRRRLLAGTGIALSVATAGCSLGAPHTEQEEGNPEPAEPGEFPTEFETPARNPDEPVADSPLAEVYADVVGSIAAVRLEGEMGVGGGTAWVYEEDYLVTNEHVVREVEDEPFVWFDDTGWREARVHGEDVHSDLAVIEVLEGRPETATALPLVEEPAPVGTEVAAIGNPFDLTGSFTTGVISGRNRNINVPDREFAIADGVQTDAALNPGNSGGPIVTQDREVAGIVSAGITGDVMNPADNVGFAISARMARRVVPTLIEDGEFEHTQLGALLTDVTPELIEANELDVTWGVYVDETVPGEGADGRLQGSTGEATVRGRPVPTGGDVILEMRRGDLVWPIETTERLSAFLALHTDPGDVVEIEVERDGVRETVEVPLGSRDD